MYLDRTAFYPTSGGQPHDTGLLAGTRVIDVVDEEGRIKHVLDAPLAQRSGAVRGTIDAERRADLMQQHSGQHLVSAIFADALGLPTLSVHFGPDSSTLDLDADSVSADQLAEVERRANAVVAEARPVTVEFEDASSARDLRKATDRSGEIRVITIAGIDRSACGGTHVSTTAAIGPVLLRSTERMRKQTRVEFLCGQRAVRAAKADHDRLIAIGTSLSAAIADVPAQVAAQAAALKDAEQRVRRLERELATLRARARYDAATPSSGRRVLLIDDATSMEDLRALAQACIALPGAVVIGAIAQPPSVLLAAAADSGVDAGAVLKDTLTTVGGRGGGSPRIAQGSVADAAVARDVARALRATLDG